MRTLALVLALFVIAAAGPPAIPQATIPKRKVRLHSPRVTAMSDTLNKPMAIALVPALLISWKWPTNQQPENALSNIVFWARWRPLPDKGAWTTMGNVGTNTFFSVDYKKPQAYFSVMASNRVTHLTSDMNLLPH